MIQTTDQLGNTIVLKEFPKRIISIVPSQTELLFDLGLDEKVVGITKFCIHPESWYRSKSRVGGTKSVSLEKVKALKPDLIIGNKEENFKENIEELRKIAPVWMSDIYNLEDALEMIKKIGDLTDTATKANPLIATVSNNFQNLLSEELNLSCSYYIWKKPYMVAGKDTFIDTMLPYCGLKNGVTLNRYPELDENLIKTDVILLSSEPFPFKEEDVKFMQEKFPHSFVKIVDGEIFSWYGSRLLLAPTYLRELREEIRDYFERS